MCSHRQKYCYYLWLPKLFVCLFVLFFTFFYNAKSYFVESFQWTIELFWKFTCFYAYDTTWFENLNLKSFYLPKLMSGWKFSLLISVSFGRGGGKKSHRKVTFISKQKCFRTFLQFLHFLNKNTINYKAKIVHRALVKV